MSIPDQLPAPVRLLNALQQILNELPDRVEIRDDSSISEAKSGPGLRPVGATSKPATKRLSDFRNRVKNVQALLSRVPKAAELNAAFTALSDRLESTEYAWVDSGSYDRLEATFSGPSRSHWLIPPGPKQQSESESPNLLIPFRTLNGRQGLFSLADLLFSSGEPGLERVWYEKNKPDGLCLLQTKDARFIVFRIDFSSLHESLGGNGATSTLPGVDDAFEARELSKHAAAIWIDSHGYRLPNILSGIALNADLDDDLHVERKPGGLEHSSQASKRSEGVPQIVGEPDLPVQHLEKKTESKSSTTEGHPKNARAKRQKSRKKLEKLLTLLRFSADAGHVFNTEKELAERAGMSSRYLRDLKASHPEVRKAHQEYLRGSLGRGPVRRDDF